MLLRAERWAQQAEAAQAHNKRLLGVIGGYSVRSHLAMPTAPAVHAAAMQRARAANI